MLMPMLLCLCTRLHLFKWKCSKGSNILKCYYNSKYLFSIWIFKTLSYSCDAKLNFQHDYLFSVTWSFRNHSNMLLWCWINISYYYWCWKPLWYFIFLCTPQYIFFSLINRKFKRTAFFLIFFFVTLKMSLSLLINVMYPCWIKESMHLFQFSITNFKL